MKDWVRRAIIRHGLLFLVAVVLVAGFWFHSSFYDLGFVPLLLIGGAGTFLMLLAIRASASGRLWRRRPSGDLPLRPEQAHALASGTLTLAVVRMGGTVPAVGSVVTARIPGQERPAALLEVHEVHRRLASDIGMADARAAGYADDEQFRQAWTDRQPWKAREIAVLISLRPEESR